MKKILVTLMAVVGINMFGATMSDSSFKLAVDKAVDFITAREGFRSQWYDDATGRTIGSKNAACKGTATIGHGLTGIYWDANTITVQQSKNIVRGIVEKDAKELLRALKRTPSVNNLAALCSLSYRRGVRAILRSQTFKAVNDSNWKQVSKEWREFNTSNGKVMKGLIIRCDEELKLFYAK